MQKMQCPALKRKRDFILELMRRLKGRLIPRQQSSQIDFLPNGYT
nr:MAG TPA: hypothetical protein [Bacteriophage sp.]